MSKLKREIVRGAPIRMGAHEVVPEAEVWSWQKMNVMLPRRFDSGASAESEKAMGFGITWAWARPTALIDREGARTHRVRIVDRNRRIEWLLLIAAALLPIVLNAAARLARQSRPSAVPAQHSTETI